MDEIRMLSDDERAALCLISVQERVIKAYGGAVDVIWGDGRTSLPPPRPFVLIRWSPPYEDRGVGQPRSTGPRPSLSKALDEFCQIMRIWPFPLDAVYRSRPLEEVWS